MSDPASPYQYVPSPEAVLSMKAAHLDALTACLMGDGFDEFKTMSDDVQGNFMWLIHDLASEIRRLVLQTSMPAKG